MDNDIEEEEPMDLDDLLYVTTNTTPTTDTTFINEINYTANIMIYQDDIIFTSEEPTEHHTINLTTPNSLIIDLTSPTSTFINLTSPQPTYLDLRSPSPPIVDEYAIFQQEAWEEVFLQQQKILIEF